MEIAPAVSNGIDMICRCNFTNDYITDETFVCNEVNPDLIIINGRIISTNDSDSSDLVGDLEEWASSGPTVVVQGKELRVVSSETSSDTSSGDDKVNSSGKEQEDSSDDEVNSNGKEEGSNSGKEQEDSSEQGTGRQVEAMVRVYHVYEEIWDASIDEELLCAREHEVSNDCTDREVCVAPEECVCSAGWTAENCTEGT